MKNYAISYSNITRNPLLSSYSMASRPHPSTCSSEAESPAESPTSTPKPASRLAFLEIDEDGGDEDRDGDCDED